MGVRKLKVLVDFISTNYGTRCKQEDILWFFGEENKCIIVISRKQYGTNEQCLIPTWNENPNQFLKDLVKEGKCVEIKIKPVRK